MQGIDAARGRRLVGLLELAGFAFLVVTHWCFFIEHRVFDQLLNYGQRYTLILNAGEARFFYTTLIVAFPAAALLVDASLRLWPPAEAPAGQPGGERPPVADKAPIVLRLDPILVAAILAAMLAGVCALAFGHAEFTDDERMYLFQARAMLDGSFTTVRPQPIEFFHYGSGFIIPVDGGRWAAHFPPGMPALIALGMLVHAPHLLPPIVVALTVWAAGRLATEAWGRETGILAAILVAASPTLVLTGATYHNDVPTALFGILALRTVLAWQRTGSLRDGALVGALVGACVLCRPFDGFLVALLVAGMLLEALLRTPSAAIGRRSRVVAIGAGLLGGLPFAVVLLLWQKALMGNALVAPYSHYMQSFPGAHAFGFGRSAGFDNTVSLAFSKGFVQFARFDTWLFGWPLGGLIPAFVLVGLGRDRVAVWLLAAVGVQGVGYWLYATNSCHTFGSYYELPLVPILGVLTARGLVSLRDVLRVHGARVAAVPFRTLGALFFGAMFFFWGPEIVFLARTAQTINAPLRAAEEMAKAGPIVVFYKQIQPSKNVRLVSWVFGPPVADGRFRDPILWATDFGIHNQVLLKRVPERRAFFLDWKTEEAEPVLVPWTPELGRRTSPKDVEDPGVDFAALEKVAAPAIWGPQPSVLVLPDVIGWAVMITRKRPPAKPGAPPAVPATAAERAPARTQEAP